MSYPGILIRIIIYCILSVVDVFGQDQIIMKNGSQIIECKIIKTNDSLIYFLLPAEDPEIYSIPIKEIYGYLLENPRNKNTQINLTINVLVIKNPSLNKKTDFREGSGILYALKSDKSEGLKKGKIVRILEDSLEIENTLRKKLIRQQIGLNELRIIGKTTLFQNILSFIIFPINKSSPSQVHFHKVMATSEGWKYVIETRPSKTYKKYRRKEKKLIRLPDSVKKVVGKKNKS